MYKRKEVIGDATLYLGDCLEILPTLDKVDAVITDPPYQEKTHKGSLEKIDFKPLENHDIAIEFLKKTDGWVIAFCEFEQLGKYSEVAGEAWIRSGIWDKVTAMPQLSGDRPAQWGEAIAIMHNPGRKKWNGGGKAGCWRFGHRGKEHPTGKPVKLMNQLVADFSDLDAVILDPFMGSGTTGVACMNLGRKFIGIEIEEKYFNIACERIENAQKQGKLFDIDPR